MFRAIIGRSIFGQSRKLKSAVLYQQDVDNQLKGFNFHNPVMFSIYKQLYSAVIAGNASQLLSGIVALRTKALEIITEKKNVHSVSIDEMIDSGKIVANDLIANEIVVRKVIAEFKPDAHRTFLHFAILIKSEEMIKSLINSGTDTNSKNLEGNTPLHYAMSEGHIDTI